MLIHGIYKFCDDFGTYAIWYMIKGYKIYWFF